MSEIATILEESIHSLSLEQKESHLEHVKLFCKLALSLFPVESLDKSQAKKLTLCAAVFASLKLHQADPVWTTSLKELTSYTVRDLAPLASKMVFNYGQLIRKTEISGSS